MILTQKYLSKMLVIVALMAAVFAGCDSEKDGSYNLLVRWNIAGLNVCKAFLPEGQYAQDELIFDSVEINIFEDENSKVALQPPIPATCGAMQTKISRLPRGSYFIRIDAYAPYNGESLAFFKGEATVSVPAEGNAVDIPLTVGDGQIEVNWQFAGGRICGIEQAGEVADVVISLNGEEMEAPCGEGHMLLTDVYPNNTYRITALALDANGDVLYEAVHLGNPFEVLPGQTYPATVIFQ